MTNIRTYDISNSLYKRNIKILAKLINKLTRILYHCEIPYSADVHHTVQFAHHGLGVVLGHDTKIGEGTKILQNVTIGGRSGIRANPVIGKNVMIGAGAVVLGDISIGDNVKIGANAVVLTDLPNNATAVGVPARVIKINTTN